MEIGNMTDLTISQLQKQSHELARKNGWHEQKRNPPEFHMLIVSEIAEATEEARKGTPPIYHKRWIGGHHEKPEGELIELADAMIRIADYAESRGWDLAEAINLKHEYNKTRSYRHGGKLY